jgi:hypothetical protein
MQEGRGVLYFVLTHLLTLRIMKAAGVLIGAALAVKCDAFFGGAVAHGAKLSQQSLRMQNDIFTKGSESKHCTATTVAACIAHQHFRFH